MVAITPPIATTLMLSNKPASVEIPKPERTSGSKEIIKVINKEPTKTIPPRASPERNFSLEKSSFTVLKL